MKALGYLIHFILLGSLVSAGVGVGCCLLSFIPFMFASIAYPAIGGQLWFEWVFVIGAAGMALYLIGYELRGERMFP